MNGRNLILLSLLPAASLAGCVSLSFERAAYDALYQWQCLKDTGVIRDCDPHHPAYDEYRKLRKEVLERD